MNCVVDLLEIVYQQTDDFYCCASFLGGIVGEVYLAIKKKNNVSLHQ